MLPIQTDMVQSLKKKETVSHKTNYVKLHMVKDRLNTYFLSKEDNETAKRDLKIGLYGVISS